MHGNSCRRILRNSPDVERGGVGKIKCRRWSRLRSHKTWKFIQNLNKYQDTEQQWPSYTGSLQTPSAWFVQTHYKMSHNFLHNLQILQTNPGAHLTSCSMAPRAPSARVKRSVFEADHSTLSSVKVENECSRYTSTYNMPYSLRVCTEVTSVLSPV